jgi:tetratricopeptide (TPR) repeat protein
MNRLEALLSFYADDPNDPFNAYALALEYRSLGQLEKAIEMLESLQHKFPDYVPTYYQLAKLWEETDMEKAEQIYIEGMKAAEKAHDKHAYQELKAALQMMLDELL